MSDKEFDKTLQLTKYALLISGIKTSNDRKNKAVDYFMYHYQYYCNFIALYSVIFGETYWFIDGIRNNRSFVELSLVSPCITISLLGTIKSWCVFLNNEILVKVVDKLKEIHPMFDENEAKETVERNIMKKSMKLLKFVQVLLMSIYILVFTTFCFIPVLISGYNYHKTGDFVVAYPFEVKYHFDVYNSSFWPLIYFTQVWATAIVIFNVFGCDTLFYALCVYLNMHFHLLGLRFENIVSTSKHETRRKLAMAVVRHRELIDLVDQSEILYSKSSLFNFVTSSLLICLSGFNITVADETIIIFAFITFLLMSLSQISMICYFGDLLMNSSVKINEFVYNCRWYEADEESKRTILLVMMRYAHYAPRKMRLDCASRALSTASMTSRRTPHTAKETYKSSTAQLKPGGASSLIFSGRSQKACRLTAWKFAVLNLGAFTTILSRSWSYFALLKTVYK